MFNFLLNPYRTTMTNRTKFEEENDSLKKALSKAHKETKKLSQQLKKSKNTTVQLKKELKKNDVRKAVLTKEQEQLLSSLSKDMNIPNLLSG